MWPFLVIGYRGKVMTIHLKECQKRIRQRSIQSFDYLWVHLEEFGVYFGVFCQFFFGYIGIPLPPPPLVDPVSCLIYSFTGICVQNCGHPFLTGSVYLCTEIRIRCGLPFLIGVTCLFMMIFV